MTTKTDVSRETVAEVVDPYQSGEIVSRETPRNLDELLKLDSYQGMTDDEIKLVIAYKEYYAQRTAQIEAQKEAAAEQMQAFRDKWADMKAQAQEHFEQVLEVAKLNTLKEV